MSRYGKLPEIHHIFKEDSKNPPIAITLAFLAITLAALPILAGAVSTSNTIRSAGLILTEFRLVALSWRQLQPPSHRIQIGPYSSCRLPGIVDLDRGRLLPLLYLLEHLPTAPGHCCGWCHRFCQWQSRFGRSPGPTTCRPPVTSNYNSTGLLFSVVYSLSTL